MSLYKCNITYSSNNYRVPGYIILIPEKDESVNYQYELETNFNLSDGVMVQVFLVNSKTGYKYTLPSNFSYWDSGLYIDFYTNSMSDEDSFIDYLEFKIDNHVEQIYKRQAVTVSHIRSENRVFKYQSGTKTLSDSNLSVTRSKFGFAKWSSVHKNQLSNALKLSEPLHSVFNSSIYKTNELYKRGFSTEIPDEYEEVFLAGRPLSISRLDNGNENFSNLSLKETDCISSSIVNVDLQYDYLNLDLINIIVDPYDETEYLELNNYLPCQLYFKSGLDREDILDEVVIEGYDYYNNLISETVTIRRNIYTSNRLQFNRITRMECNNAYEVSNYVDCKFNHSVIDDTKRVPPICDNEGSLFFPTYYVLTNEELDEHMNTKLVLNNDSKNLKDALIFDFNEPYVESAFIDNDLNVFYTVHGEGDLLKASKLSIDMTKTNYNDTSINSSELIAVSNKNTVIGDWIEVTINTSKWFENYSKDVCYITCKNDGDIYYFHQEEEMLMEDKILVYRELMADKILTLYVRANNSEPYLFTIMDEEGNSRVSSLSHSNVLVPHSELYAEKRRLIHYNNRLVLTDIDDYQISYDRENYGLVIEVLPDNNSKASVLLKIGDYFINNKESNLPSNIYRVIESPSNNHPTLYLFNLNLLRKVYPNSLDIGIGAYWDKAFYSETGDNILQIKIIKEDNLLDNTYLSPEVSMDVPTTAEYSLTINIGVELES